MVAYSYKKRFAVPVALGLGLDLNPEELPWLKGLPIAAGEAIKPKRQTIRADRKRHARPGEELQHYCGMRTKGCFLIGRARCTYVRSIVLEFRSWGSVLIDGGKTSADCFYDDNLNTFAQSDGFEDWETMKEFWRVEHGSILKFKGVLIQWEPLP